MACCWAPSVNLPPKGDSVLMDYFLTNRTEAGLVLDRESDPKTVSVAATGFGMDCWAMAAERGTIKREEARFYIDQALDNTVNNNPKRNEGWLYHFTDRIGRPSPHSEVSTIDTAIFYLGARQAAARLGDQRLIDKVERLICEINLEAVRDKDGLIYHGFCWDGEKRLIIPCKWDTLSEGVMLYKLFGLPFDSMEADYNLPLFVFYYPLCFFDDPDMQDRLKRAVECQKATLGYWGHTATDGPDGYMTGGSTVVSPLAIWSLSNYVPGVESELKKYPVPRHVCGYQLGTGWASSDKIGIDYGCGAILLNKRPMRRFGR